MTSWTEAELRKALDDYERELRMSGKTRNTVATYVQHPERFINWLVGKYSPSGQGASIERQADGPAGGTKVSGHSRRSRYDPLQRYLRASGDTELRMSFAEIEEILGCSLPASASRYPAWWANEAGGSHTHARAWLGAGRRTRAVDVNAGTIVFTRVAPEGQSVQLM